MQNVSCAAITNTKYLLMTYEGYLSLFMPPYPQNLVVLNPKMYLRKTSQIRKMKYQDFIPCSYFVDLKRGLRFHSIRC